MIWNRVTVQILSLTLMQLCHQQHVCLNVHPSPYSGISMKANNTLPMSQGWRRKPQPGSGWWLMPHNQSIGRWGSEIRRWTRRPEEACDLPTIHLCPHLVLLNVWRSVLPLNSPPLTKQADVISLSVQLGLWGHNTTPTSVPLPLSVQPADPGPTQKT